MFCVLLELREAVLERKEELICKLNPNHNTTKLFIRGTLSRMFEYALWMSVQENYYQDTPGYKYGIGPVGKRRSPISNFSSEVMSRIPYHSSKLGSPLLLLLAHHVTPKIGKAFLFWDGSFSTFLEVNSFRSLLAIYPFISLLLAFCLFVLSV